MSEFAANLAPRNAKQSQAAQKHDAHNESSASATAGSQPNDDVLTKWMSHRDKTDVE